MNFDDFCDQVERRMMACTGWSEFRVADFISPRIMREIQAYKEGISILETVGILLKTLPSAEGPYWD